MSSNEFGGRDVVDRVELLLKAGEFSSIKSWPYQLRDENCRRQIVNTNCRVIGSSKGITP
jgi:hypothetical protein